MQNSLLRNVTNSQTRRRRIKAALGPFRDKSSTRRDSAWRAHVAIYLSTKVAMARACVTIPFKRERERERERGGGGGRDREGWRGGRGRTGLVCLFAFALSASGARRQRMVPRWSNFSERWKIPVAARRFAAFRVTNGGYASSRPLAFPVPLCRPVVHVCLYIYRVPRFVALGERTRDSWYFLLFKIVHRETKREKERMRVGERARARESEKWGWRGGESSQLRKYFSL